MTEPAIIYRTKNDAAISRAAPLPPDRPRRRKPLGLAPVPDGNDDNGLESDAGPADEDRFENPAIELTVRSNELLVDLVMRTQDHFKLEIAKLEVRLGQLVHENEALKVIVEHARAARRGETGRSGSTRRARADRAARRAGRSRAGLLQFDSRSGKLLPSRGFGRRRRADARFATNVRAFLRPDTTPARPLRADTAPAGEVPALAHLDRQFWRRVKDGAGLAQELATKAAQLSWGPFPLHRPTLFRDRRIREQHGVAHRLCGARCGRRRRPPSWLASA
jgi:hypothetical protein